MHYCPYSRTYTTSEGKVISEHDIHFDECVNISLMKSELSLAPQKSLQWTSYHRKDSQWNGFGKRGRMG